jgi:hypothetical protein
MGSKLGGVTLWLVRIPHLLLARSLAFHLEEEEHHRLPGFLYNKQDSLPVSTSHSLTFSPSRRVTVFSLFSVFTFVKQMPWQLHSRTAFYDSLLVLCRTNTSSSKKTKDEENEADDGHYISHARPSRGRDISQSEIGYFHSHRMRDICLLLSVFLLLQVVGYTIPWVKSPSTA